MEEKKPKTVLITGSSSGIGAEIACKLSHNGYKVFITGRNNERLESLSKKISVAGYLSGDLHDKDFYKTLFTTAENTMGQVDILINNAGDYVWSPVEKTGEEDVVRLLRLNLEVPYNMCRLAVSGMKQRRWGRLINIGSISGAVGEANASLYSASKAGLTGMTKALALELAEYGITVNIINPGWVKTELASDLFEQGVIDESEQLEMIPQRRFIHPSEIAALVNYLVSEDAKGITGQSMNICAGLSLG